MEGDAAVDVDHRRRRLVHVKRVPGLALHRVDEDGQSELQAAEAVRGSQDTFLERGSLADLLRGSDLGAAFLSILHGVGFARVHKKERDLILVRLVQGLHGRSHAAEGRSGVG